MEPPFENTAGCGARASRAAAHRSATTAGGGARARSARETGRRVSTGAFLHFGTGRMIVVLLCKQWTLEWRRGADKPIDRDRVQQSLLNIVKCNDLLAIPSGRTGHDVRAGSPCSMFTGE